MRLHLSSTLTPKLTALHWAFAVSIFLHALLLSVKFEVAGKFNRLAVNTNLPLILVNVRLNSPLNTRAQAVAQSNLRGGGAENSGIMSSPLPSAERTEYAADPQDNKRSEEEIKRLEKEQQRLLSMIRSQLGNLKPTQDEPLDTENAQKRQRLLEMLAQIETQIDQSNKRPHIRYYSPSTKESAFAQYYDQMRRRIEAYGTQHFPQLNGRKLYGKLLMSVNVNSKGQVINVDILEGSGQKSLDQRARATVSSAGPFDPFGADLASRADQIELIARYEFTQSGTLETSLQSGDSKRANLR